MKKGDRLQVNYPGSEYHGRIGAVQFTFENGEWVSIAFDGSDGREGIALHRSHFAALKRERKEDG